MDILKSYQDEIEFLKKVEYNETLKANCLVRDTFNYNYPQVGFIDIRAHDMVIHINRPIYTADHGIEIYVRDDAWRDASKVEFKLNWLTTEIYVTDTEYLDYLEVLGFLATEFKKKSSSFIFMLKSIFIKLGMYRAQIEVIQAKMNEIVVGIAREKMEHETALFKQSVIQGEYFVKPFAKDNKRYAHAIYIGRVADKTVSHSTNDNMFGPDIVTTLTSKRLKRVKNREFFNQYREYTIIDANELRTMFNYNKIYNEIQTYIYWNGLTSLDAPFAIITMLVASKVIPNNDITAEIDAFINDSLKTIKELKVTRYDQ